MNYSPPTKACLKVLYVLLLLFCVYLHGVQLVKKKPQIEG